MIRGWRCRVLCNDGIPYDARFDTEAEARMYAKHTGGTAYLMEWPDLPKARHRQPREQIGTLL